MTSLVSYAQNFEDVLLWRAVGDVDWGVYVDVGAQSPDVDSVSRLFFEHGWRGVHVEPVPAYAQALRDRRPGDVVVQAAVGAHRGLRHFHVFANTGLSTLNDGVARGYVEAGREEVVLQVPTVTLDDVLAEAGPEVHWLKIDVEGAEADVIQSWQGDVRPWIVVVEATRPMSQELTHEAWESSLLARGYRFALFDGLNRFYVSDACVDRLARLDHGACVFDGFALGADSTAPFAAAHRATVDELELALARERQACGEVEAALVAVQAERHGMAEALAAASVARDAALAGVAAAREALAEAEAKHGREAIELAEAHAVRLETQATEYLARLEAQDTAQRLALESAEAWHRDERNTLKTQHANERAQLQHEREALQARYDELVRDVQWLRAELSVQRDRTIDAIEDARRWQAMAQGRAVELASVYASMSWRVTAPLRATRRGAGVAASRGKWVRQNIRARLRGATIRALRAAGRLAWVRRLGAWLLRPFPPLERRARWAVLGHPAQQHVPDLLLADVPRSIVAEPSHAVEASLSPYANDLLALMRDGGRTR